MVEIVKIRTREEELITDRNKMNTETRIDYSELYKTRISPNENQKVISRM